MGLRMHLGISLGSSQRLILPGSGFLDNQPAPQSLVEFLTPHPNQKLCFSPGTLVLKFWDMHRPFLPSLYLGCCNSPLIYLSKALSPLTLHHTINRFIFLRQLCLCPTGPFAQEPFRALRAGVTLETASFWAGPESPFHSARVPPFHGDLCVLWSCLLALSS